MNQEEFIEKLKAHLKTADDDFYVLLDRYNELLDDYEKLKFDYDDLSREHRIALLEVTENAY